MMIFQHAGLGGSSQLDRNSLQLWSMVIRSPRHGVLGPLPNGHSWLINWIPSHPVQLNMTNSWSMRNKPLHKTNHLACFGGIPLFFGGCQKLSRTVVLLMVQKSHNHHLGCIKNHVTKGTNYQPQLVCRISSINSINTISEKPKTMDYRGNPSKNHNILALFYFLQMGPIGASQHEA